MSDGFPSRSCADAILSHGEVDEDEDRSPPVRLVFCRGHRTGEVQTRLTQESRVLWTVRRVELWIVVPGPDGERPG
jgi:hypothetical protein